MSDRRQFLKQAALLGVSPWLHEKTDPVQQAALHSHLESDAKAPTGAIVLENQELRLVIAGDATAQSLIHSPTGQECLAVNRNSPMFTLTQYRPYDNELQQTYPAITTHFPGTKIRREGNKLNVSFDLVDYEAIIGFTITQSYIAFRLEQLIYKGDTSLRPKLQTPIDEAVFVQLPVRNRENIGRWLNVVWDRGVAVNLLATDASTRIDAQPRDGYHLLRAGGVDEIKLEGLGAALIVTTPEELLDRIAVVENDFDLPRGVESRRRPEFKYSYYQMLRGTPETIDRHLSFAKLAGLRTLYVYYRAFAKTCGHFPWKPEYPNGMEDLKAVVQKINQANILPGIHIHYNKADKEDAYVTGGPDPRLNLTLRFTLGRALDATSTTITVLENPRRCTLDDKRRVLKIANELISYEQYTTAPPYQFLNCKRGILGSQPSAYPVGVQVGQLDVDTLPVFVRFTQDTDIQQEVADRLAAIYRDAGFKFVYFDGAEDVPGPHYWYTVSRPQWIVYQGLNPKPLFAEGACQSHFSWHIVTRGNAFDNFRPEVQKAAVRAYPATAAPMSAKDFTPVNFGWVRYWAPGKDTIGTQPDMLEYTSSRAAAWDCPVSLVGNLDALEAHPRTPDNLEVIRRWEDVRIQGWLTREQKAQLRNLQQEHTLLMDENGQSELVPCDQIANVAGADRPGRAFVFERQHDIYVMFWHSSGEEVMRLPLPVKRVVWMKDLGKPLRLSGDAKSVKLPFGDRRYLRCNGISRTEVITAFQNAKII